MVKTEGTTDISFDTAFEEALGVQEETGEETTEGQEETSGGEAEGETTNSEAEGEVKDEVDLSNTNKEETVNRADVEAIKQAIADLKPKGETKSEPEQKIELPKTDEDWAKFEEDWPEVAQVIRKERDSIKAQVEQMVAKALEPFKNDLNVVVKKNEDEQLDKFVREVQSVHPKAIEELPELLKWADSQPKHIALGIKHVLENSTDPKDVIEIYNTFKGTSGASDTDSEESNVSAKSILKKMEVVNSRRTKPTLAGSDPSDFDGAFEQAVKQFSR